MATVARKSSHLILLKLCELSYALVNFFKTEPGFAPSLKTSLDLRSLLVQSELSAEAYNHY